MAQFFVYKNMARNKQIYPYFIDIQSDFLNHLNTRLVIPLAHKQPANSQVKVLSPILTVDQADCWMMDASHLRDELVAAIDFLILGI
uniref:CcdB family protein n=1 Tax=Yersinia frederiksenii TaxID=29484 RepID=UPI001F4C0E28|nr:CcdB family protein [Yersinia frederiksenii]ULG19956.1 hypothetical protein 49p1_00256 [Yersinia frederiksenii]